MGLLVTCEVLMPKTTVLHQDLEPATVHLPCVTRTSESLQSCDVKLSFAKQQDSLLCDHDLGLECM